MENQQIPQAQPVEPTPAPQAPQPQGPGASGRAVAALVMGILSIVCMGFLAGIPAIVLGSMELKAIKAGASPQAGESAAKVGFILGIVGTVLTCLTLLGFVMMVILGVSLGGIEGTQNVSLVI